MFFKQPFILLSLGFGMKQFDLVMLLLVCGTLTVLLSKALLMDF